MKQKGKNIDRLEYKVIDRVIKEVNETKAKKVNFNQAKLIVLSQFKAIAESIQKGSKSINLPMIGGFTRKFKYKDTDIAELNKTNNNTNIDKGLEDKTVNLLLSIYNQHSKSNK